MKAKRKIEVDHLTIEQAEAMHQMYGYEFYFEHGHWYLITPTEE